MAHRHRVRYARVLTIDAGVAQLATTDAVQGLAVSEGLELTPGDLVEIDQDRVLRRVRPNRSSTPLHEQDWWRLHHVLPNLRVRGRIISAIRGWFEDRDFLEVEAPLSTTAPCPELHVAPVPIQANGEARWLVTSPELHLKRLLSSGVDRIYSMGRVFRDGERGPHHHLEFTMLEWYRAGEGTEALMRDTEALVELAFGTPRTWTRLTVAEALRRFGRPTEDPDEVVRQLVEVVEPALAEMGAVFLTDYPATMASLARVKPGAPHLAERFEAYVDGVELANGFGELTDPDEQRRRFERDLEARAAADMPVFPLDERFLDALAAGLPPCAGIALGIDRLVMAALGAESIDDVVLFTPEDG